MRFSRRAAFYLPALIGLSGGCAPASTHSSPAAGAAVTSKDLQDTNEPIEIVLQKKVPGLLVTRTAAGGIALQIRGATSFSRVDTRPLYVLNGVQFDAGPGGELTGINPYDIESIKVLKGADATAVYGIQGANGVIVITTKQAGTRRP